MDLSGARWRKSSCTTSNGGDCVELAGLPGVVAVRDSKDQGGPALVFSRSEWRTFLAGLKREAASQAGLSVRAGRQAGSVPEVAGCGQRIPHVHHY